MPTDSSVPSASTHNTDSITTTWILSLDYEVELCRLNDSIKNTFEHKPFHFWNLQHEYMANACPHWMACSFDNNTTIIFLTSSDTVQKWYMKGLSSSSMYEACIGIGPSRVEMMEVPFDLELASHWLVCA